WHIETHKAQAIAARSYALYHMKNVPPSRDFDVYAGSAKSQAYGEGTASENEKSRQAVKATRGVVLIYNDGGGDRIFEAFYHSTCGGRTVAVQDYFAGGKAIKPLGGVKCNYCAKSKHFRWQYRFSAEQLRKNFLSTIGGMEDLKRIGRIEVLEEDRTADGRAKIVSIWTPEEGSPRWPVPVAVFKKQAPAGVKFKTDRFTVGLDGSEVVVEGRGFGHGIGMCQFGAEEQARRGRRAAGILNYYYPGSKLVRVY
ncbi:MAG: SpoIID/LytB domain-containing protein, partial [Anaerolineaceae bacterium]|nr:SpoIID/LytB domain-containing protein [Anaerolineaceae bacterium]